MFDLLGFIDSPDIREYNRDTEFAPDEQAVLVAQSRTRTVEDKIAALEYLRDTYTEEELRAGKVEYNGADEREMFPKALSETIRVWKKALQDRYRNDGCVFTAVLNERECDPYDGDHQRYFSSWEKAYAALLAEKQKYLDDEDLREVPTVGIISRFKLDAPETEEDRYLFDNEMHLNILYPRDRPEGAEDFLDEPVYTLFVPVPFHKGDIVRCASPFHQTFYGVFPYEWERPEPGRSLPEHVSLDIYTGENFDYTDDTDVMELTACSPGELPEKEKPLKLVSLVDKGKMRPAELLWMFSTKGMDGYCDR